MNFRLVYMLLAVLLLTTGATMVSADSPKSVATPDRHSIEVSGKIAMYRVQVEGMDLGEGKNKANAEVYVTLSSNPKTVYTLSLRTDDPISNQVMADTLRDAYLRKIPVKLYHQIAMDRDNNFKILMVQLGG